MTKLKILVGTMTNTAEFVALAIQMDCADLVEDIEVLLMDGLDISTFDDPEPLYLICSSTYGTGDVPDNARNLYDSLDAQPKFLGHVRYGVIALGDSTYAQTLL
jgi:MioC protein